MAARASSPISEALLWKGRMSRDNRVLLNSNTELASQVKALTARVITAEEAARNVKILSDRLTALESDDNEMHKVFTRLDEDRGHRLRALDENAVAIASKVEKVVKRLESLQTCVEELQAHGEKSKAENVTRLDRLETGAQKLAEIADGFKRELSTTYESTIGETGSLRQVVAKLEKEVRTLAEGQVVAAAILPLPVIPSPAMAADHAANQGLSSEEEKIALPILPTRSKGQPNKRAKTPAKRVIEKEATSFEDDKAPPVEPRRTKDSPSTRAKGVSAKQRAATTAKKANTAKAPAKRKSAKLADQVAAPFTNTPVPPLGPHPAVVLELDDAMVNDLPTKRPSARGKATRASKRGAPKFTITDDAPKTLSEEIEEQEAEGRSRAQNAGWVVHATPQQADGTMEGLTSVGRGRKRGQRDSPIVTLRSRTTRGGHSGSSLESQVDYARPLKLYRDADELSPKSKEQPRMVKAQPKRRLSDVVEEDDASTRTACGGPTPPAKRVKYPTNMDNLTSRTVAAMAKSSSTIVQEPASAEVPSAMHNREVVQPRQTHKTLLRAQGEAVNDISTSTNEPNALASVTAGNRSGTVTTPAMPKNLTSSSSTLPKPGRRRKARMPNLPPTPELRPQPDDNEI